MDNGIVLASMFRLSEMGFKYDSTTLQHRCDVISSDVFKMRVYIYILRHSDSDYEISAYKNNWLDRFLLEGVTGYSKEVHIQLLEYLVSIGFVAATGFLREYKIDKLIGLGYDS